MRPFEHVYVRACVLKPDLIYDSEADGLVFVTPIQR